jgi:hypothetical protein
MVRFTLKPIDQEDADPVQEVPTRRSTWQVTGARLALRTAPTLPSD